MADALIPVPFHGTTLHAVLRDGKPYVSVRSICEALSVDFQSQRHRIKRHPVLEQGVVVMTTPSPGGPQQTVLLPLDLLNGWLFGITAARVRDADKRQRLVQYQRECFKVLARHFGAKPAPAEATQPSRLTPAQAKAACKWIANMRRQLTRMETQVAQWTLAQPSPPSEYLRARVEKAYQYPNGNWSIFAVCGDLGLPIAVSKAAMCEGGVRPGDRIRMEYSRGVNPLVGPFKRICLLDEPAGVTGGGV